MASSAPMPRESKQLIVNMFVAIALYPSSMLAARQRGADAMVASTTGMRARRGTKTITQGQTR